MSNIKEWLTSVGYGDWNLEVASSDASFRSYYRLTKDSESYIVMDSSKLLESLPPFIDMQEKLEARKVRVPRIIVKNIKDGYLILEDFGKRHFQDVVDGHNDIQFYKKAIDEIVKLQHTSTEGLPHYDKEFLLFEMSLMKEWYLEKYLNIEVSKDDTNMLENSLNDISNVVLQQPQGVVVHRDFHCRNIMVTAEDELGVIDFQDARVGAITYDLVSLLKDCYIELPKDYVKELAIYFKRQVGLSSVDDETFFKWFDFMGMQRHIKVLGIFARLSLRDGKDNYLDDIPLTLKYILETSVKYEETKWLHEFLKGLHK